MKILVPAAYYSPELFSSSHLTDDLEEYFVLNDFEVVVVTPRPTRGLSKEDQKAYKAFEEKYDGKIKVYRVNTPKERANTLARAFRYFYSLYLQYKNL